MGSSIMQDLIETTQEVQSGGFEQKHQESLLKLQECQKSLGKQSCFNCEKVLECEIRKEYVKDTYALLNRGQEGGFDF